MDILREMSEKYGVVPLSESVGSDVVYWTNWYENEYEDTKTGNKNTSKNYIYWLDGLRVEDWLVNGEETMETRNLKEIMGHELMGLVELGYDFEENTFKCYLLTTTKTVDLVKELLKTEKKNTYPQELRFRLLFQTKGNAQKILREQIEKYVTKIMREKGFERFLLEEVPQKMKKEYESKK